jgi:CRP/FNR family transcriptional regulator
MTNKPELPLKERTMNAAAATVVTPFRVAGHAQTPAALRSIPRAQPTCSTCTQRRLCMPADLDPAALRLLDHVVATRVRLKKGDTLYHDGDRFADLYAIRSGSCKTLLLTEDGHEQVAGFHMAGDILGIGGIDSGAHGCRVVALEDTEVCALPFERIEEAARGNSAFQHGMHRLLSREIVRERSVMLMLGAMRAEQRLAAFLLDLSRRYQARGYSSTEFVLRMTREEIGSHLGLKLETVSRLFSRFHQEGIVLVQGRVIKLLDRVALQQLLEFSPR